MSHTEVNQLESTFEIGKLYYERGDFHLAIPRIKEAANLFFAKREFSEFLQCQNYLLRMHAEREEFDEVNRLKEMLQDLVLKEGFELNAKTYYTLAICATFKDQNELAIEYFQKSLSIALATDSKVDMCYAIYGLAVAYKTVGRYTDALREIYNLQVFFQVVDLPELKATAKFYNGIILTTLNKNEEALTIFWSCYDDLKQSKDLGKFAAILRQLGLLYHKLGDKNLARTYLSLALRSLDPENHRLLCKAIQGDLSSFGFTEKGDYDIIFETEKNIVTEQRLGKIEFKNQFILLDLLKLFLQSPGEIFSKEDLVEKIWNQKYDPTVHDNKIYVTIKRLRKLIEPDFDNPKYIYRSKTGYYLNKSTKVLLDH